MMCRAILCHVVLCYAPTAQVLGIFPTTIRRKILRQLYSNPLNECYLFKNTGVKFLDALMLGARVELFLPKVILGSKVQGSGFRVRNPCQGHQALLGGDTPQVLVFVAAHQLAQVSSAFIQALGH